MTSHRAVARPADAEQSATLGALENGHRATMPLGNALHDRLPQPIATSAPGTLAAVIQARERQEDAFAIRLGNPRAIVFHLDTGQLAITAITQHHPALCVTQRI